MICHIRHKDKGFIGGLSWTRSITEATKFVSKAAAFALICKNVAYNWAPEFGLECEIVHPVTRYSIFMRRFDSCEEAVEVAKQAVEKVAIGYAFRWESQFINRNGIAVTRDHLDALFHGYVAAFRFLCNKVATNEWGASWAHKIVIEQMFDYRVNGQTFSSRVGAKAYACTLIEETPVFERVQ